LLTLRRERWAFALILLVFIFLGLSASVINPLHEATDELRHYRFVRYIATNWSLPVQGETGCSVQGHHPPLIYFLGAVATAWIDTGRDVCHEPPANDFWGYRYWEVGSDNKNQYLHGEDEAFPWHGEALAAHIVRAINVLIGAGVVILTRQIGRAIWPSRPAMALGAVAFVAFNPMFLYMAGSINNDVIAALSGAATTWACIRLLVDQDGLSRRWGIIFGILYGIALLSKFNLIALILLVEVAISWVAWRKRQWHLWWQVNATTLLLTLLIAGWWFVRNQVLYGEPTGFEKMSQLWGARVPSESLGVALFELSYAWTSLWGRFGYGQIPLPDGIYAALKWIIGLAFFAIPITLLGRRDEELRRTGVPLLFLGLSVILFLGVLFGYMLVSLAGPMGRFFFPALPSLAILIFFGFSQWARLLRQRFRPDLDLGASDVLLAAIATVAMLLLSIVALFGFLSAAFQRPPSFAIEDELPNPINVQFDTLVKLRGYDVSDTTVSPGDSIRIDLYWEVLAQPPGNYLLFIHLVDEAETMVAQRDTHPGLGNFQSSLWRPGDRFVESVELVLPETAYAASTATLSAGLYARDAFRLGITSADGAPMGDALNLATVAIVPKQSDFPNPLDQNFSNEVRLAGYQYSQRLLQRGDSLTVTLYWQALNDMPPGRVAHLHLLDESGVVVSATVGSLGNGGQPTTGWKDGQVIEERYLLTLGPDLAPGIYHVRISLLDPVTGKAQNIVADDGHWIDDELLLAGVRIQP